SQRALTDARTFMLENSRVPRWARRTRFAQSNDQCNRRPFPWSRKLAHDPCSGAVVWRQLERNPVARECAHVGQPHLGGDVRHDRSERDSAARWAEVRYLRLLVQVPPNPMPDVLAHDPIALGLAVGLDSPRDIAEPAAGPRLGDAALQPLLGAEQQSARLLA